MNTATVQQQNDTLYVVAYNLPDFLASTQKLIQEGWEFDFEKNEHFPQMIGFQFVATLVKPSTEVQPLQEKQPEKTEDAPEVQQEEQPAKRGRKSKGE